MKPGAPRAVSSLIGICLLAVGLRPATQQRPAPRKVEIAEGIYLFQTPAYGDVGLDGNSVVIVTDQGVLVFDSNGTPSASEAVLREIRTLTDKPVRYLVNSHWH